MIHATNETDSDDEAATYRCTFNRMMATNSGSRSS